MTNRNGILTHVGRLRRGSHVCWALVALGCGARDEHDLGGSQQALAPAGSDSELASAAFKPEWYPGERARVAFTLSNTGTTDWTAADPSFALRSLDRGWGWRYTATSVTVAPGASREFSFVVTAPTTSDSHSFVARMSALGLGDFGATITRAATVTPSATPEWGCEYVAGASTVPAQLAPEENRTIVVTVLNVGQNTWEPGFHLVSKDSPAGLWHRTSELLDEAVNPGGRKTWRFGIRAPAAPGSYRLRREMHAPSVGEFRSSDYCVDLGIEVTGSTPLDSSIVSHDLRSPLAPGEPFLATVALRNTGTQTWLPSSDFALGSLNTPAALWGKTIIPLAVTTAPGATATITMRLAAPPTPGNYEQKWQLRKLSGEDAGYFGAVLSAAVVVDQATTPTYGATVVEQQIPLRMTAGKVYPVRISLQNTGSTTWSGSSFGLTSTNLPKSLWKTTLTSLAATENVAAGTTRTFGFQMRAPASAGQYSSAWRMAQSGGVGPFGQIARLDGIEVTLCGNGTVDSGEVCDDGNLVGGDGCSPICQRECGNSVVDVGETCDDGNVIAGDGCSPTCQHECGNGRIDGAEQCDGAAFGDATCASVTSGTRPAGTLLCTASCTFDTSACNPPSPCSENIVFEDPMLEQVVRERLGNPSGPITSVDAAELTSLYIYQMPVESLSGLECFTNLVDLSIWGTRVSDLTPLANLIDLGYLVLGESDIVDVTPLAGLTNLAALFLTGNDIERIDALSGMYSLVQLDTGRNRITDLQPLADLTELRFLWLEQNLVSDLTPLANLTQLAELQVPYNQIESLVGVAGMEHLEFLNVDGNAVSDLTPLTGLSYLGYLSFQSNQVVDLSPVASLNLWYLDGSYNLISDLTPLSGMTTLHELYLFGDTVSTLSPLVQNSELGAGDIAYVDLAPLQCPDEMSNIAAMRARGLELYTNCEIVFTDPKLERIVRAALHKTTGELTGADAARLLTLSGDGLSIYSLGGLEYFTNLESLSLPNNDVSDLTPLSGLILLTELNLNDNDIGRIDALSDLRKLYKLHLDGNAVSDLRPLANLTLLRELHLQRNQISSIASLANLAQLQSLAFDGNTVSDASPLVNLTAMGDLRFSGNQISDLSALTGMAQVFHLDASRNLIGDLTPLANLPNLMRVYLADNQISTLARLVENDGVNAGDTIILTGNPLECSSESGNIQVLHDRAVNLETDCGSGQSCVARKLVGAYGFQMHNERRICQKYDLSCSAPSVQDLPATISLYTLQDDPSVLEGSFHGPGLWLSDSWSGYEFWDAVLVYYPGPGDQPSIWERYYPGDQIGEWDETRVGDWVRILFDNGCTSEYGPAGFVHIDIEMATGRVLDFLRYCEQDYSTIRNDYRMTGSGSLICEGADSCNDVENTAAPAEVIQVEQPDIMGACQLSSGRYHLISVRHHGDEEGSCIPPPDAVRETLVVDASTPTSGTLNRTTERAPLQPFSTTYTYQSSGSGSSGLNVRWACGAETLTSVWSSAACATDGNELKIQLACATYIYQKL